LARHCRAKNRSNSFETLTLAPSTGDDSMFQCLSPRNGNGSTTTYNDAHSPRVARPLNDDATILWLEEGDCAAL